MALVEIYARPMCGFCAQAKKLLDTKGVAYAEYDIWAESGRKEEMVQRSNGGMTVPQIFIDDAHVGGCDDLMALERSGKLDPLLGAMA
ncbi:glutaredoxin 3 [Aestuariispira ectoiniformans]|uniref:glutaredoxin 3 n=1 Tax=Aestuariispira ectoiniformans TaxID=2775080 RepID=UPI00223A6C5D|nr:glutaredoxin 3 [Aestuariispira ectoiniformans]